MEPFKCNKYLLQWKKYFRFFNYKENCGSFKNYLSIDRLTVKKIWLVSHGNFCFYIKLRKLYEIQFGLMQFKLKLIVQPSWVDLESKIFKVWTNF